MSRRRRYEARPAGQASTLDALPGAREGETSSEALEKAQAFVHEQRRQEHRRDLLELLAQPAFRRYMGALLYGKCFPEKIWRSNAEINVTAARHDFGREVLAQFREVDFEGYLLLEREQFQRAEEERSMLRDAYARFTQQPKEGTIDG